MPLALSFLIFKNFGEKCAKLRIAMAPAMGVKRLLPLVQSRGFVLTPDIALKMHILNERRKVSGNVIIQVSHKIRVANLFFRVTRAQARRRCSTC